MSNTFKRIFLIGCITFIMSSVFTSCGIYSFRDVSIDYSKIKTIKIGLFDNKARYVNPQLATRMNDKLQQKIASTTKLIRTNGDDANLQISGYISDYSVSTSAISATQATSNRLTVAVHVTIKNNTENKEPEEVDISRNFDFPATKSLQDAEAGLMDEIVRTLTDDIFNHIFSNW